MPGREIAGVRAPALNRPMPKAWTAPEPIFNGKDLTGLGTGRQPAEQQVGGARRRTGERQSGGGRAARPFGAANIKTTRKFDDFKLHIEVNCPEHGNSGIYLRGRYEIQVGTEGGTIPSHEMGALYGHFAPAGNIGNKLGQWTSFDITLCGTHPHGAARWREDSRQRRGARTDRRTAGQQRGRAGAVLLAGGSPGSDPVSEYYDSGAEEVGPGRRATRSLTVAAPIGAATVRERLFFRPYPLEQVPEELVVDFVVVLHFGRLDEGAEQARAAVGGGLL